MASLRRILKTPRKRTLTILIGIPGVGKSALADKMLSYDPENRVVVSSDKIRFQLTKYEETGVSFDSKIESKVWVLIKSEVRRCLENQNTHECILDATNIKANGRKKFIQMARESNFKTRAVVLYAPFEEILSRNQSRERTVSEEVIQKFYFSFQSPKKSEFDTILYLGSRRKFEKLKRENNEKKKKLKISGFDIMDVLGIPPGKRVGEILEYLEQSVNEKVIPNRRKILLQTCIEKFKENE